MESHFPFKKHGLATKEHDDDVRVIYCGVEVLSCLRNLAFVAMNKGGPGARRPKTGPRGWTIIHLTN